MVQEQWVIWEIIICATQFELPYSFPGLMEDSLHIGLDNK